MNRITRVVLWLTVFSIAMAFLESAIVVYLRAMMYPEGFAFPLQPMDHHLAVTEFWREFGTVVMLVAIGVLAGRNNWERFGFFIFCFAVWDIFYYVFLFVLLEWPQGLAEWDILFLIPIPWVGPVWAPCVVALTMIGFTFLILWLQQKGRITIKPLEWGLMVLGCIVIIGSFMLDYIKYVTEGAPMSHIWTLASGKHLFEEAQRYIPQQYAWWIFVVGEGMILWGMLWFTWRNYRYYRVRNSWQISGIDIEPNA